MDASIPTGKYLARERQPISFSMHPTNSHLRRAETLWKRLPILVRHSQPLDALEDGIITLPIVHWAELSLSHLLPFTAQIKIDNVNIKKKCSKCQGWKKALSHCIKQEWLQAKPKKLKKYMTSDKTNLHQNGQLQSAIHQPEKNAVCS